MNVQITKKSEKKFRHHYPLLQKEDLVKIPTPLPNDWVTFIDQKQQVIGYGYLGKQNRGIGWLISWNEPIKASFFVEKFRQAKLKRDNFLLDEHTTAFRIFNAEGDGIGGLTIDRYENFAVFSWYNETLFEKKEIIIESFKEVFPEIIGAYEKIRFKTTKMPESQKLFGEDASEPLLIKENGVTYATYLNEGLMTGIFLDQKEVRNRLIDGIARDKNVLNTFSYTGAFSVAAAMGGARTTTSVDLAKRSLNKTQEQFEVNHLPLKDQRIIVMDIFDFFGYARKKNLSYDVVILDPPSFARNKKKVFSVAKNYGDLIRESLSVLTHNGLIIASTNASNLSKKKYQQMIETVLTEEGVSFKIEEIYQLPEDFAIDRNYEESNYLKVFFITIIN